MKNAFRQNIFLFLLAACITVPFSSCKKKGCTDSTAINYDEKAKKDDGSCEYENGNNGSTAQKKQLVIKTGAKSIEPGASITYEVVLVDESGTESTPSSVTWSSESSEIATINASGAITTAGTGSTIIKASVTDNGVTYTASVVLNIAVPGVFGVVPSALVMYPGEIVPLLPVFFTTDNPTYTYTSSNTSIATVDNQGFITAVSAGNVNITVAANTSSGNPEVIVPILIVPEIIVPLPVVKVTIDPGSVDLFKNDTKQLSAKAFDFNGAEVNETFTWSSSNSSIVSVDNNGLITANEVGETYIQATAKGITAQAEIYVSPDTVVIVTPFMASIGQGATKQYTAKAYNARTSPITELTAVTSFNWEIPSYGPGFELFDVGTVNSSGLVTVKSNASIGAQSFVIASVPGSSTAVGVGIISVSFFSADCGTGNPDVASINITNTAPIEMSLSGNPVVSINAEAKDTNGATVSNPALKYSSSDTNVIIIDENTGEMNAVGMGTSTITVCSGSYASSDITVNVSF